MIEQQQRQTAYKIWIASLINTKYMKGHGEFDPGYIEVENKLISRVNLIGGVIDKFSGNEYSSLTLDDGSGIIKLKLWKEDVKIMEGIEIGDLINSIGKVRSYNNEIFIFPEIIRKVDNPLWIKVRKLELIKLYGEQKRVEKIEIKNIEEKPNTEIITETVGDENDKIGKVISLITTLDLGHGVDIETVIKSSGLGEEAQKIIKNLIKDGEIFEVSSGKVRLID